MRVWVLGEMEDLNGEKDEWSPSRSPGMSNLGSQCCGTDVEK